MSYERWPESTPECVQREVSVTNDFKLWLMNSVVGTVVTGFVSFLMALPSIDSPSSDMNYSAFIELFRVIGPLPPLMIALFFLGRDYFPKLLWRPEVFKSERHARAYDEYHSLAEEDQADIQPVYDLMMASKADDWTAWHKWDVAHGTIERRATLRYELSQSPRMEDAEATIKRLYEDVAHLQGR